MEEIRSSKQPHNLILEERKSLTISGVSDIDSFNEQTIAAFTDFGELIIRGNNLHINKLNVETGELFIEGEINAIAYVEGEQKSAGFLSKMFK